MKSFLAVILSASSVALANEPRDYGPQEVEALPEYEAAVLAKLTEQPLPPGNLMVMLPPAPPLEIPRERLDKMEAEFRAISLGLGHDMSDKALEITNEGYALTCRDPAGLYLSVNFDKEDRPLSVYISGDLLPLGGNQMVDAEKFEAYAIKCHRLAFGGKPQGELKLGDIRTDADGISGSVDAVWTARPGGIPMVSFASVRINKSAPGWTLSLSRGPNAREVAVLAGLLQKHPTRISEAQAVAIAWKNWKAVRPSRYEKGTYRIWPRLREIVPADLEAWSGTSHSDQNERQAWLPAAAPGPFDPIAYEIHISDGLFQVNALVDRRNGKILRLNQHRMSW